MPDVVMPFGKHQGMLVKDLPRDYLRWLYGNIDKSNAVYPHVEEALGFAPATPYIKSLYKRLQIPQTLNVIALIQQCISEGWANTNLKGVLADAMEEAEFKEPDTIYSVLNALRTNRAVPINPFFDALCIPEVRGELAATCFYAMGEPAPKDMSATDDTPWPSYELHRIYNPRKQHKAPFYTRKDVETCIAIDDLSAEDPEVEEDDTEGTLPHQLWIRGPAFVGTLKNGMTYITSSCRTIGCKSCCVAFVGEPLWDLHRKEFVCESSKIAGVLNANMRGRVRYVRDTNNRNKILEIPLEEKES